MNYNLNLKAYMMILTVNQINNTLSGIIGTEKYNIPYTKETYDALVEQETAFSEAESLEEAKATIEAARAVISAITKEATESKFGDYLVRDDKSNKFYLKLGDVVSKKALPQALVTMLLEALDKGMSIEPYVKCWAWFLKNPRYTDYKAQYFAKYLTTKYVDKVKYKELKEEGYDHEQAIAGATFNDISITKNGLLSTYKYAQVVKWKFDPTTGDRVERYDAEYDEETGVKTVKLPENAEDYTLMPPIMGEGGDAYFAGDVLGHRIVVGAAHRLPENARRNTQDGSFGGGGLHLGGLQYIDGYGGHGRLLLNCFVNPMHILGFSDSGDGAIRVDAYFVQSACFAPNKGFYNESNYLAQNKAEWEAMLSEILEKHEEAKKRIDDSTAELKAL